MRASRRTAWPAGFLGMLVLTFGCEVWVARRANTWANTIVQDWREAGRTLTRKTNGADVLYFGSSMMKFGVQPGVVEAKTGRPGYNLSLLNGPVPASYFMLKRAFAAGARPTSVVVDIDSDRLGADPLSTHFNYPWADLLTLPEAFDLARRTKEPALFGRLAVASLIPSVGRRHDIRRAVRLRMLGFTEPLESVAWAFAPNPSFARNRRVNHGAVVIPPVVGPPSPNRPNPVRTPDWRPDPVSARYASEFLRLAASKGAAVTWVITPVSPDPRVDRVLPPTGAGPDRYEAFVRKLAARVPGVTVVDGWHSAYPASAFIDNVHLDAMGAAALSQDLAPIVTRARDRPLWVTLPAYQVPPAGVVRVENLARTEALLTGYARR